MSTASEFAGRILARTQEKPSINQTCSLLSQYMKENRAAFGDFNLSGKPEIFRQAPAAAPMNLFPVVESAPKNQVAGSQRPMDFIPQFVDSSSKMFDAIAEPKTAQMTIFYDGQVLVFNDFPADKAKEIMLLAGKGSNSQAFAPQPTFAPRIPNTTMEPYPMSPIMCGNPVDQIASDLPLKRRNSLHRFLEKRKDRLTARSPYQVPAMSATPDPAEAKKWLSLAASSTQ